MKVFNSVLSMSALVLAVSASIATGEAQAVTLNRSLISNSAGICQAALPAFEGLIRKRPLAVQNEGTGSAFITCSFTSQTSPSAVTVWFHSVDGAAHSISCTGISGYYSGGNQYVPKTVAVPAAGQSSIGWSGADFTGGPAVIPGSGRFSAQCAVDPQVGIDDIQVNFSEDVGT